MEHLAILRFYYLLIESNKVINSNNHSMTLILLSHDGQLNLNGGVEPRGTPNLLSQLGQDTLLSSLILHSL